MSNFQKKALRLRKCFAHKYPNFVTLKVEIGLGSPHRSLDKRLTSIFARESQPI